MDHICVINPPGFKTLSGIAANNPSPPVGLAYIAAQIRQAGYRVTVIDAAGEAMDQVTPMPLRPDILVQGLTAEQIIERIPADVSAIGVSCAFSTNWPITREVIKAVHEARPQAPVFVGGEHATALPEHVLETSPVEACVIGEGEQTVLELLPKLLAGEDLHGVPGLVYREGDRVVWTPPRERMRNIDHLPLPAWDLFPIEQYISSKQMIGFYQGRAMPLVTTRGCPFRCTFCSSAQMWTTVYTMRDVRKVVDEMELYMARYGAADFHFHDLTAVINKKWIIAFCDEILNRGLKITWQMPCGTRCESIDDEVCAKLAASGCRNLTYAPESGSEHIRQVTNKRVNMDHFMASIRAALRHKLDLCSLFLIGTPQETKQSLRQTLWLIRRLAWMGMQDVGVSMFVPYPGSQMFREMLDAGRIQLDDDFFISAVDFCSYNRVQTVGSPQLSAKTMYRWMLYLFLNFYIVSFVSHPARTIRMFAHYVFTGREESRFAKWLRDRVQTRRAWRKAVRSLGRQPSARPGASSEHGGASPEAVALGSHADAGVLAS